MVPAAFVLPITMATTAPNAATITIPAAKTDNAATIPVPEVMTDNVDVGATLLNAEVMTDGSDY
jgi:hypothetical protein